MPKPSSPPTDLPSAIKDTAWRQIAEFGAPALSLRAIARELHITAPAIYNYFARRDDLVTALIIDAYNAFGDSQQAAQTAAPAADPVAQLLTLGLAYRDWALANPQRYQLLFGTPIPGYAPPVEKIQPAGVRSLTPLVSAVEALRQTGRLRTQGLPLVTRGHKSELEIWKVHNAGAAEASLSVALLIWGRVHGLVSLEIGGYLPPFGADGAALYRYELDSLRRQFVLEA